ncbi:MAG: type II toxin-antitoxin system RelE/ParE family toxin [Ignavibacteria bacterium]|nr:type II toxin-antitoxin system RelE/ParE family toxin [Ignavibacteria bacterium]
MNYKIKWTSTAYSDFSCIILNIKEMWGKNSAQQFINQIKTTVDLLSMFPQSGKVIFEEKQIRAFVISKQTTIIYRIKQDIVTILNLFDNRQNPDNLKVNDKQEVYKID